MTEPTAPPATRAQIAIVVAVAFAAALVAPLWIVEYLPTGDGPNHVLLGYLTQHLHDADKGYDAFLTAGRPVSALAFHAVYSALLWVLPWRHALRATLSLGALLWAGGFASVVLALSPRRAPIAMLGFATALSWSLYMGLFSFWMSHGLALLVLGYGFCEGADAQGRLLVELSREKHHVQCRHTGGGN